MEGRQASYFFIFLMDDLSFPSLGSRKPHVAHGFLEVDVVCAHGCGRSEDAVRKRLQSSGQKVLGHSKWPDLVLHNGRGIANRTRYNDVHYNHTKN